MRPSPYARWLIAREVIDVANKDKGGSKSSKKQASHTLKEKRAAKKAKAQKKASG